MTTTLSEGVKVPDVGSVNWAGDLEINWNLLNGALANLSGNVKLDRDNTWTGEQSFTLPIVGSITGTASKAIADEDGTSIKTGYGKLAGNQTWSGNNTFTGANAIRFNNTSYVSGTPSGNIFYSTVQWGGYVNNTWSAPFTINNAIRTNGYNDTSFRTYSQTSNTLTGFVHETNADASDIAFRPIVNGTHNLGNSSYKWKTINGINPGSLSLPNWAGIIDISGSITPPAGEATINWSEGANTFTPPADGWVSIRHDNCKLIQIYQNTYNRMGVTCERANYAKIVVCCPVRAGSLYTLIMNAQSGTVNYQFYPCLGNV